jgi:excisionase family DNA binding protein
MNETDERLIAILRELVREEVRAQLAERGQAHILEVEGETLLTVREVAKLKRVSERTVYDWVARDKVRPRRTPSGQLRFKWEDIE